MPKNERHSDWQADKSERKSGGDVCSKSIGGFPRRDDNAVRDNRTQSSSEKEYRKHGWNVEYANESEEGYSKKA
jgi:hypothetical protein